MTTNNLTLLNEKNHLRKTNTSNTSKAYKFLPSSTGLKSFIAFIFVLFLFTVTHVLKFPGSVGYLMEITHGLKTLDLQPSFSSGETYQRLEAFGEIGRQMYMRTMLTVDFIFPLSMFIFLFLFSKYTSERWAIKPVFAKSLLSLSIAYVMLDFLENVGIFFLLSNFPERLAIASFIGYLTVGKRISMMGAIFIPAILLAVHKLSIFFKKIRLRNN
jgi:hypothetical protein